MLLPIRGKKGQKSHVERDSTPNHPQRKYSFSHNHGSLETMDEYLKGNDPIGDMYSHFSLNQTGEN